MESHVRCEGGARVVSLVVHCEKARRDYRPKTDSEEEKLFAVCKLVIKAGKMFSSASNDDIVGNFSAFSDRAQFGLVRFLKHAATCGVQS